jgi:hypothetical protein
MDIPLIVQQEFPEILIQTFDESALNEAVESVRFELAHETLPL